MVESHSINFKLYLEESFKSSNSQFIRIETAFLLSGELYFATIKLDTDSINSLGLEGFRLPVRILETKEESYPIERAKSAILIFRVETSSLKFLLNCSKSITISLSVFAKAL